MSIILSIGRNAGLFFETEYVIRLNLWWIAITIVNADVDDILEE